MTKAPGILIGTVVGNTSPQEFRFYLKSFAAKLGDLVCVVMKVPQGSGVDTTEVIVWGRIVELARFNPFLPAEAGQELADEGVGLLDTVLSYSRDQIEGKVLVLGCTTGADIAHLRPLNYPVSPGSDVRRPPSDTVKNILTGDEKTHRIRLGHLVGRGDVEVSVKTNPIVARHMAVLAMTGGGKTVAARRVVRELLDSKYPTVIMDPHGDYLGFWSRRDLLAGTDVKLFYPSITVKEENRDLIGYLVANMTQGFTDPQRDTYYDALERIKLDATGIPVIRFIERLLQELKHMEDEKGQRKATIRAIMRGLKFVRGHLDAMEASNKRLREHNKLLELPFEPMPDPVTDPGGFARPGQLSVIYLGGYDHITQSTIVAVVLKNLFDHRASMKNTIPPVFVVIEEAHNFIPSRGEGQAETPSVEVIRKVITEGRKFGVGLLLVSQRPSRLDETTLSQCNTFLVFRLVNPRDQSFVEKVMENLSKADSRMLPGFGPGQGIVSGQAVRFPLMIQVDYDKELLPPSLGSESFVEAVGTWTASPEAAAAKRSDELERQLDIAAGKADPEQSP